MAKSTEEPTTTWSHHPNVDTFAEAAKASAQDPNGTFADHLEVKESKKGAVETVVV